MSWKTTLLGWATGALNLFASQQQTGHFSWGVFGTSIGIGVLGTIAKDFNVTGGTIQK